MRTILSSGLRPRIGQTQIVTTHSLSTPVRGTNRAPLRRPTTFCDAFTILLCPVFAAAFAVDITRKDKRRQELNRKIAQIQSEIDRFKEKELRVWESLQWRSIQSGVISQRRSYSTTSDAEVRRVYSQKRSNNDGDNSDELSQHNLQEYSAEIDFAAVKIAQKFENYVAVKLGLELLLFISTGREPTARLEFGGLPEPIVIPKDVNELLMYLQRINRGLAAQRSALSLAVTDTSLDSQNRRELDAQVSHLSWQCRIGNISVKELIYRYTNLVMYSDCGLSVTTYQNLVSTLSTLQKHSLVFIAMGPYFKTQQVLNDRVIANIIRQYGNVRDPGRLDRFLRKLASSSKGFRTESDWERVVVNEISVPVPMNRHPRILDLLIRVSLQSNQPHRARAWTTILIHSNVSARRLASIFLNFVKYCGVHIDWSHGQLWLLRTITFAAYFANRSSRMLSRLVFRMLDLCIICNKPEQFDVILDAAVTAGLEIPPLDETRPDNFTDRARDIRDEWELRLKEAQAEIKNSNQSVDAAITFQTEIAKVHSAISEFVGITDIESLRALTSGQPTSSTSQEEPDLTPDVFSPNPWIEPSAVGDPDDVVQPLSGKKAAGDVNKWPTGFNGAGAEMNNKTQQQWLDLHNQYLTLQDAHEKLTGQYQQLSETTNAMRRLMDGDYSSHGVSSADTDLPEIARKALEFQKSQLQYRDRYSQLQREAEDAQLENAELQAKLEVSMQNESELTRSIDQLREQFIQSRKAKSLEAVFVEKENLNLHSEMKTLSEKYSTALSNQKKVQRELSMAKSSYEKLEAKSVRDADHLQREIKNLHSQLETANAQSEKLNDASRAREGHLKKVIEIYEARQKDLRAELAELKSSNSTSSESTPVDPVEWSR